MRMTTSIPNKLIKFHLTMQANQTPKHPIMKVNKYRVSPSKNPIADWMAMTRAAR